MFAMEIEISLPQKAVDVGEKMADAVKEDTGHFFDHWYKLRPAGYSFNCSIFTRPRNKQIVPWRFKTFFMLNSTKFLIKVKMLKRFFFSWYSPKLYSSS